MTEKLKLPVRIEESTPPHTYYLVDADGVIVLSGYRLPVQLAVDALNATARRCDGCIHWERRGPLTSDYCWKLRTTTEADDCCRKGWKARDEPKGEA